MELKFISFSKASDSFRNLCKVFSIKFGTKRKTVFLVLLIVLFLRFVNYRFEYWFYSFGFILWQILQQVLQFVFQFVF